MALAPRQTKAVNVLNVYTDSDNRKIVLDSLPVGGSSLTVRCGLFHADGTPTATITDNHGNTWTELRKPFPGNANWCHYFWLCSDVKLTSETGFEITITPGRTLHMAAIVREYPGILAIEQDGFVTGFTTNPFPVATSAPTTTPETLVETFISAESNNAGFGTPTGFTIDVTRSTWQDTGGSPGFPFAAASRWVTSSGTQTASWPLTPSALQLVTIVALRVVSSGGNGGSGGSSNAIVPRNGQNRMHQPEYKRIRGGIRAMMDGLWNIDVQGTKIALYGFVAQTAGPVTEHIAYWADGIGYAGGDGGKIDGNLYEQLSDGQPNVAAGVYATFQRIPNSKPGGMSGGIYAQAAQRFSPDTVTPVKDLVPGVRYVWRYTNSAADATTNWSCVDAFWTTLSNGRPIPWIEPLDWFCGSVISGTFRNWTLNGAGTPIAGYAVPCLQMTVGGQKWGIAQVGAGNITGRYRDSNAPFEQYFLAASVDQTISSLLFNTSKVSGSGGFDAIVWDYTDSKQIGPTLSQSDPGNNAATGTFASQTHALHAFYELAFTTPIVVPSGHNYGIRQVPQANSVWRNSGAQHGKTYGFVQPAAIDECQARYWDGSAFKRYNFWSPPGPDTVTDQTWRMGYTLAGTAGSVVTISGFGELPTDYPITSIIVEGTGESFSLGGTQTHTVKDQNGVPVIGATFTVSPSGRLTPDKTTTTSTGEVTFTASNTVTESGSITFRYVNATGQTLTVTSAFRIGSTAVNAPAISAAARGPAIVELTINDQSSDETGFEIERGTATSGPFTPLITLAAHTGTGQYLAHTDTTVQPQRTYYYRARATGATPSAWSNLAAVTTPAVVVDPDPTITLQASTLTISAPGAITLSATATDTTRVQFYRNGVEIGSEILAPFSTTVPFANASANGIYTFTAQARSASGKVATSNAVVVSVNIPVITAPNAPSNLRLVTRSDNLIAIEWDLNSTNETAVLVEMSTGDGGFALADDLDPGSNSYVAAGLLASTRYGFRVRVQGPGGFSGYTSPALSVITLAPPATGLSAVVPSTLMLSEPSGGRSQLLYTATDGNGSGRPGVAVTIVINNREFADADSMTAVTDALGRAVFNIRYLAVGQTFVDARATDGSSSIEDIARVQIFTLPAFTDALVADLLKGAGPLDPKFVEERFPYPFDFRSTRGRNGLATDETIQGTPVVQVVPRGGDETDANPALMLFGSPRVAGQHVIQYLHGGVPGTAYYVRCTVTTNIGRTISQEISIRVYATQGRRASRL